MATGQGKYGMVKGRTGPARDGMTKLAVRRESGLSMIRIRRVLESGTVTTGTVGRQPGINTGAVAVITVHG